MLPVKPIASWAFAFVRKILMNNKLNQIFSCLFKLLLKKALAPTEAVVPFNTALLL